MIKSHAIRRARTWRARNGIIAEKIRSVDDYEIISVKSFFGVAK